MNYATRIALFAAALLFAGCNAQTDSKSATQATGGSVDSYDVSKMDFKPGPAQVTTERHIGPFSAGSALSLDATVKPLVPDPIKEIRLDTTHKVIEIAPGVKFSAWTFGDQVPGPIVRARVGDRIKFSMTNRSDEVVPGLQVTSAPMMHSMDFHSAMVSPQDKYRSIAPGQTINFEFTPNYPGVYMYHCGTPMVLEHIASGMYGMMIVEPRGGYPTKVDREYAVIQSEFYTMLDPQKRKIDGQPLYVLDGVRVRSKAPTYTVFNGRYNGFIDKPLSAKPGERVRLFVMNVGPSNTSSFHVVGTIFDRVWIEGNPDNQFRGMQTVLLGSSNGAIVEFMIPEAGKYVMVDHHFANASQGAIGLIAASDKPAAESAEASDSEHHNIPATAAPSDPVAVKGKLAFESKCLACHSIAGGDKLGPDLYGVTKRRDKAWITKWLKTPEQMLQSDATAKEMLAKYKVPMPNQNLTDDEIRQYFEYFKWVDANLRPQGKSQPQPAAQGATRSPSDTASATPIPAGGTATLKK
jgi:nitrite reductase (NO-forming)